MIEKMLGIRMREGGWGEHLEEQLGQQNRSVYVQIMHGG
jgi:hypothetical protein